MIDAVTIATNRYAPDGAQAICMYSMDGGENLTLGQLMAAVCIKAGAGLEAQSVFMMNKLNRNNSTLEQASGYLEQLCSGPVSDSDWTTMKNFFTGTLGITDALPNQANSYNDRLTAAKALRVKLEELTRESQEDMIDVQSLINRRDVAFTTATNLISALGSTKNNTALNY